ncbi:hypothetical protein [Paenibacillus oryzisoli]|uniref:F5/8 type C domain-containing protein n=1 Tax=Paenibacillus oryzisoli TaxID=1850517 RepID=A0A198AA42_9BACL|nr:hypothetical protein [Paenibacillus oryzisoli]OAS17970.1 hypothetical protein A8708_28585 [Paenibacillus oryzisoli]
MEDQNSDNALQQLAGLKVSIEGEAEVEFVPTWIPVTYVDANDGYANVNTPDRTIDNDLNTRWSATSQGEVKWIRYDLGNKVNVHSMSVSGYLGNVQTRYIRLQSYGYGPTKDGWNGFSEVRFYTNQEQANLDASKWDEYFAPSSNKVGDQLQLSVKGVLSDGTDYNFNPETTSIAFFTDNAAIAQVKLWRRGFNCRECLVKRGRSN